MSTKFYCKLRKHSAHLPHTSSGGLGDSVDACFLGGMTGDALPDCPVDFKASRVMVARRLIGARKLSACVKSVEGWVWVLW